MVTTVTCLVYFFFFSSFWYIEILFSFLFFSFSFSFIVWFAGTAKSITWHSLFTITRSSFLIWIWWSVSVSLGKKMFCFFSPREILDCAYSIILFYFYFLDSQILVICSRPVVSVFYFQNKLRHSLVNSFIYVSSKFVMLYFSVYFIFTCI